MIVRRTNIRTSSNIFTKSIQLLGYADDIDIFGRNIEDLKMSYTKISSAASDIGLKVNVAKTKYMLVSRDQHQPANIAIGTDEFEVVSEFTYLGSSVNSQNNITEEIKRRILLANRTLFGLSRVLRSRFIRRGTKMNIYKTLILPVLMYGCEAWTLSEADQQLLMVFERKVLRLIFGPVCVENEWRIRYNDELYSLYGDSNIMERVRQQQLTICKLTL